MYSLTKALFPEMALVIAASILFLMGTSRKASVRKTAPVIALIALAIALVSQLSAIFNTNGAADPWQSIQISEFSRYVKLLSAGLGILLTLLAWPTNEDATAGPSIYFGNECAEFFALMLLSIAGLFLVAGANDMMLLFLAIELSSLPTYIMVSISRPLPVAQEAGVKYFFLGAMAAALLLFGFSYLYGTTGTIYLHGAVDADGTVLAGVDTAIRAAGGIPTAWQILGLVLLIGGLSFKMVAAPLHVYAADVYQGAATPVTAFLSFVPKAAGFVGLLKVLFAVGGSSWVLPHEIGQLIWWIAVLTMCSGNVLGLLQNNIKRVLAYSSIAHSGYMLAAVAALISITAAPHTALYDAVPAVIRDTMSLGQNTDQAYALRGVLFYLAAYGLTNIAAFGVLIMLPGRSGEVGTSAETFEEIAGLGRANIGLGLAMAVACFSLIGIPLTVGFIGKVLLVQPALQANLPGLVVILMINSAVSAVYYLRIVATLFLRPASEGQGTSAEVVVVPHVKHPLPITAAVLCSAVGVLVLGAVAPLTDRAVYRSQTASKLDIRLPVSTDKTVAAAGMTVHP